MTSWLLLLALAAPVVPDSAPLPSAPATPSATPVAADPAPPAIGEFVLPAGEFVQSVRIACPAGTTRTTFPLVANTLFELETVDAVSSKTNHSGDRFDLRLREPLRYGPVVLVPAGTPVHGEVAHATENRWGGIAGELILAARYVQLPTGRLRLRSSIAASGKSRTGASATTVILFGIAGVFVQGDNRTLPAGTPLSARLAEPVTFECEGAPAPSAVPSAAPASTAPSAPLH
jgi:hypothetical protein